MKGDKIRIWEDPWLPKPFRFHVSSAKLRGTTFLKAGDLVDSSIGSWNDCAIKELFNADEASIILRIPIPVRAGKGMIFGYGSFPSQVNFLSNQRIGRLFL